MIGCGRIVGMDVVSTPHFATSGQEVSWQSKLHHEIIGGHHGGYYATSTPSVLGFVTKSSCSGCR